MSVQPATQASAAPFRMIRGGAELEQALAELAKAQVIGIDTETTGLDPLADDILLIQLHARGRTYVVDARSTPLEPLRRFAAEVDPLWVLQNAKFDCAMLEQHGGIHLRRLYDVMLAERLLTAGISREISLAALASKYLGIALDKSIRTTFDGRGFSREQLEYAARDAAVLLPIFERQWPRLQREGLIETAKLEFQTVHAVVHMELAGCKIDASAWEEKLAGAKEARDRAAVRLAEILAPVTAQQLSLFGGPPELDFNSQPFLLACFKRLGHPLPDTAEATLRQCPHPLAEALLEYRAYEKLLGTYGESLLSHVHRRTGRIHADFDQYGTDTGRFSCRNPNVQQIPAEFRPCFVAEEGHVLVIADYSQIELRILAEVSGDPAFREIFRRGGDLHSMTAAQMFGVPLASVSKEQRSQAKAINFGLAYGRGPHSLALQLGVTPERATELIDRYFEAYAGVRRWLDEAGRTAVTRGCSVTLGGRKRYFELPERSDPNYARKISQIERQGKNTPIQGTSADMIKWAMILVERVVRPLGGRLINSVHDELVVEAPEETAEEIAHRVNATMVEAGAKLLKETPVQVEVAINRCWDKSGPGARPVPAAS
ncbi:MAG TPA: DNA polymerase [Limnochordia bacterium]